MYYTIIYITILYYNIRYITILYYIIPYFNILYYIILYYAILCYALLCYTKIYLCYAMQYYIKLYHTIQYCAMLCYVILYQTTPYHSILYYTILYSVVLNSYTEVALIPAEFLWDYVIVRCCMRSSCATLHCFLLDSQEEWEWAVTKLPRVPATSNTCRIFSNWQSSVLSLKSREA